MAVSPAEAGFVPVCGAPLYYEVSGAGRPLILIHEGIADCRMYDEQVAAFAARYRVLRYDVHGFGQSGLPSGAYSNHDALYDLLQQLGLGRTALLGMSMGGGIALDFALVYPELVDALILAGSAVSGYEGTPDIQQQAEQQWGAIQAALERNDLAQAVALTLRMWFDGPQRRPDQVDPAVRRRAGELAAHCLIRPDSTAQPLEPPAAPRLAEIAVPTLVIVGDGDQPDILAIADLLHQGIAGARKVVIPEVAHLPNMERPELFNRLVLDFLGE
ncbi:MAG TPA: alpha/beta fold hydrolase [Chloroflexota bacterium]